MNSNDQVVKLFEGIRLNPKIHYRKVIEATYYFCQWEAGGLSDDSIISYLKEIKPTNEDTK